MTPKKHTFNVTLPADSFGDIVLTMPFDYFEYDVALASQLVAIEMVNAISFTNGGIAVVSQTEDVTDLRTMIIEAVGVIALFFGWDLNEVTVDFLTTPTRRLALQPH
jgi:hypothetical protein